MPARRQEKMARIVKEVVSDAIANHLNDPRIEGLVSITGVEMTADLRTADVYISIFDRGPVTQEDGETRTSNSDAGRNKTFAAITHARSRIQSLLADKLQSKFCPVLRFHTDEKFKKTLETMKLIDQAVSELKENEPADQEQE